MIDPTLAYSTYLGGTGGDVGGGIAVDAPGNAYVTGFTGSSDFPTTPGAFQTTLGGAADVFISKLNATGSALVYSTYLGGSGFDQGIAIALDPSRNAYVTGFTGSRDFPTTPGAFQTTNRGGLSNAFVAELNPTGSALIYSTYLGGSGYLDFGKGITVDASGNAYVTGDTGPSDFPTTPGAFQTTFGGGGCPPSDAFVSKLNATGSALLYSTYLGGSDADEGTGIVVDASGSAYVGGHTFSLDFPTTPGAFQTAYRGFDDAFVSKLNATGSALLYSTYLSGSHSNGGAFDVGRFAIAIDPSGDAYVTGYTAASDFPTTPGAFQTTYGGGFFDTFVTKLNATGSALVYSTYLGGNNYEIVWNMVIDTADNAYVTGQTFSTNFPTTPGAFQTICRSCPSQSDAFVSKLNAAGTALLYSTYLGGSSFDDASGGGIALDTSGNAYITGDTNSSDFPTIPGGFQTTYGGGDDAYVSKFSFGIIDTTPPVTTASLSGPKGDHGWYQGAVTVTLTATDPDDAVAATYYSVDGGSKQTYSAPFSIAGDGIHQLSFYSVDAAGNQEKPHKLKIKIDATPPTITVAANPATLWPPNGEMISVSISGAVTDATSGVDPSSVSFTVKDEYGMIQPMGPVTLGTGGSYSFAVFLQASRLGTDLDGRLYTITMSAEDNAGNTASASSKVIVPHDQGQ